MDMNKEEDMKKWKAREAEWQAREKQARDEQAREAENEAREAEIDNEVKEKMKIRASQHGFKEMMDRDFRQIPKEILFCIMGSKLRGSDISIILYIYHRTFGFKKFGKDEGDKFSYADISSFTGLHKKTVERSLKRLEVANIISRKRMERKVFIRLNVNLWGAWRIDNTGKDNAATHVLKKSGYYDDVEKEEDIDGDLKKELDEI